MTIDEIADFFDKHISFTFKLGPKGFPTSLQCRGFSEDGEFVREMVNFVRLRVNEADFEGRKTYWMHAQGRDAYLAAEQLRGRCSDLWRHLEIIHEFVATKNGVKRNSPKVNQGERGKKRMELLAELNRLNKELWAKRTARQRSKND